MPTHFTMNMPRTKERPMSRLLAALLAATCAFAATPAVAHITLERQQAAPGTSYKAVLKSTARLRRIGDDPLLGPRSRGRIIRQADAEAGLDHRPRQGPLRAQLQNCGNGEVSEGVREVSWRGGRLDDAFYDEFVFTAFLAAALPAGPVYFPAVQGLRERRCARWDEIPAAGQDPHALKAPRTGAAPRRRRGPAREDLQGSATSSSQLPGCAQRRAAPAWPAAT